MSFPRYPKYKDSGVQWLGEVPSHWQVMPIRYAARLESGHTPSRNHPEYWEDCIVPWFTLADVWQIRQARRDVIYETKEKVSEMGLANSAARRLPKGTVMLSRTASVGFSAIMGVEMATTQDFANWVCGDHLKPEFLLQVLRSMHGEFSRLMMGSTHNTIYMPDIQALRFAVPPLEEQEQIHEFLQGELAKIDTLVDEQQRLIELLNEKRQAVISHAVTKGLNPNAPMRPSGVEWLGEVPAHWKVQRLKYLVSNPNGIQMGPFGGMLLDLKSEDTGYKVYGQENTISGDFALGHRWIEQKRFHELANYHVENGDILLTRKGSLGNARLVQGLVIPGIIDSDTIRVRVNANLILDRYMALLLHEAWYVAQEIGLTKRGAILAGLNSETIANLTIVLPPLQEQQGLLENLNAGSASIDAHIRECESAIELLQERRAALISAAVTGQIDIRGFSKETAA